MAENYIPSNVQTFTNDTSAVNTVNSNFAAISNAFSDVLSRSGTSPNQMGSTLDMNSNQIINLPPPATINSPARLIDVVTPGSITVTTATTGTSGHVVPFLDGTNTWSGPQTISLGTLGTGTGLNISEAATGTNSLGVNSNFVSMTDSLNVGSNYSNTFLVLNNFGSSSAFGGRQALGGLVNLTSATNASNANRNYVGVAGVGQASASDGGTNPAAFSTSAGLFAGGSFVGVAGAAATALTTLFGMECNTQMAAGSSTWSKACIMASSNSTDAVSGTGVDAMLWMFNQGGATAKWHNAILIDNEGGQGVFPISGTGTIFKTGAGTCAVGIDLTSTTFTSQSIQSAAFAVSPNGVIQSGALSVSNGAIQLNGQTSGFITISTSATSNLLTITQPIQTGVSGTAAGSVTIAGLTSGSAVISCSATGGTLQLGAGNLTVDTSGNTITTGAMRIGSTSSFVSGGDSSHAFFLGIAGSTSLGIFSGTGNPTISATKGSLYLETGSGQLWVNTSGSTTWTQVTLP